MGRIDAADRRNRLLDRAAAAWREHAPEGFVVAAGITDTAPAVARLLRGVARLPDGIVVLPGLDLSMPEEEWDALGPSPRTAACDRDASAIPPEAAARSDGRGAQRGRALGVGRRRGSTRLAPQRGAVRSPMRWRRPTFTGKWQDARRRPSGASAASARSNWRPRPRRRRRSRIALREALETPGRTAALVTPDRALARRVAAHLRALGDRGRRHRRPAAVDAAAGYVAHRARRGGGAAASRRSRC